MMGCSECGHVLHAINGGPCGVIVSDVLGEVRYCHCILPMREEEIINENNWLPGNACGACGSNNTGWEVDYGAWCGDCGRSDSDE